MLAAILHALREPASQIVLLAIGGALYLGGAIRRWPHSAWSYRLLYLLGGMLLAIYEYHMVWWWLAGGVVALIMGTRDWWRTSQSATPESSSDVG